MAVEESRKPSSEIGVWFQYEFNSYLKLKISEIEQKNSLTNRKNLVPTGPESGGKVAVAGGDEKDRQAKDEQLF
ncbi:hypothetical protein M5689_000254 [Euphorbia peplus]|nr:hypothetical protein M5689_000254 [Euphorbia peplus]